MSGPRLWSTGGIRIRSLPQEKYWREIGMESSVNLLYSNIYAHLGRFLPEEAYEYYGNVFLFLAKVLKRQACLLSEWLR
jgi:hypothetical protein